ncbi:hypothetical protein AAG747_27055 [Rapidithrix thailandica]|uniref:Uncharacterized protein n=1 Tax=Rapidithrix thailandica TaxID=413964 RepID=A0AAW9SCQ1_9BACT
MKKILLLLLLGTLPEVICAQNFDFRKDLDSLQIWINQLPPASPVGYSGVGDDSLVNLSQEKISRKLLELLNHSAFPVDSLKPLGFFHFTTSDDQQFMICQWQEYTGGTDQPFASIFCYSSSPQKERVASPSGYTVHFEKIYSLPGHRYVLEGSASPCSSCFESYLLIVALVKDTFKTLSSCYLSDRAWESYLAFDPEQQGVSFDLGQSDLAELRIIHYGKSVYSLAQDTLKATRFSLESKAHFIGNIELDGDGLLWLK